MTTDTNGLSRLEERSEGLKAFAALVAMVGTTPTVVPPIVLIDEVELHLHYDAEADLIRFFGEQSAVAQVIPERAVTTAPPTGGGAETSD